MKYSIEEVATLTGARRFGSSPATIECLLTDSRSLIYPESSLFFALRTSSGDGHNYIGQLYKRGVRNFVVEYMPNDWEKLYSDANFLLSPSPLKALQRLAERHREHFSIPIIGITGSNGKTMVKEWLSRLLSARMRVTRSPRSYNSQIGVPLSVMQLNAKSEIGIFEAGISEKGEMEALRDVIQPTIGIMVSLGSAHQENFSSMEEKCREKLVLFQDCKLLVFCYDDETIRKCVELNKLPGRLMFWSRNEKKAPVYISNIGVSDSSAKISYIYNGAEGSYTLPFDDKASIEDSIHCLCVCLSFGMTTEEIATGMSSLEAIEMRMEVTAGTNDNIIIADTCNSDPMSLDIALDFLFRRAGDKDTVVILSDILQSGLEDSELYEKIAGMVNSRKPTRLIGVGERISAFGDLFHCEKAFFPTTAALLQSHILDGISSSAVLLKGAHIFDFSRVLSRMIKQVHETTLRVNLDSIIANLNHYRSFLAPGTRIVCMVKASAYGAGALEVARTLQEHGVDYLAVAVADEGVALREAGITAGIMVMNPEMTAFSTMLHYHLEPEVYSFRILSACEKEALRQGVTDYPIHIKIDTGMHRLGFLPEEMPKLIQRLSATGCLSPVSVFSHFAGSDTPGLEDFTTQQFKVFSDASEVLCKAFPHKILRHICNTAGIERFPQYHLDMVRLGLGLYGIDPYTNKTLSVVSSLETTILQIHNVSKEDTVGYSRRGKLTRDSRIAAIPIGYADGLDRRLGCGNGYCLVNGHKAPYVGNICMDVAMIDVTDIPCQEGDKVEIFGEHLPVTVLSDKLGTIPYEILTSVSDRVKRIYIHA